MRAAFRGAVPMLVIAVACWAPTPAAAQAVDYHKAQQAGKVWERKQLESGRNGSRGNDTNSQGVAYDAPLSESDIQATHRNNPGSYERLERSVGKKNADRWLDMRARIERSKR